MLTFSRRRFTLAGRRASYRGDASEDRTLVLPVGDSLVLAVARGAAAQLALDAVAEVGAILVRRDEVAWYRLLRAIDDAVAAREGGEASLVALCVGPKRTVGASVGDCAARWIAAEGVLELTAGQKRKPGLGSGTALPIPFTAKNPRGGTLLLASAGLDKYTNPAQADAAALTHADPEAAADALVALAAGPAGQLYDDLALLLCRR